MYRIPCPTGLSFPHDFSGNPGFKAGCPIEPFWHDKIINGILESAVSLSSLMPGPIPKIIFFVTEDWYFCSHRLPLAIAAKDAGFDVVVITRVVNHGELIRQSGIRVIPFNIFREVFPYG